MLSLVNKLVYDNKFLREQFPNARTISHFLKDCCMWKPTILNYEARHCALLWCFSENPAIIHRAGLQVHPFHLFTPTYLLSPGYTPLFTIPDIQVAVVALPSQPKSHPASWHYERTPYSPVRLSLPKVATDYPMLFPLSCSCFNLPILGLVFNARSGDPYPLSSPSPCAPLPTAALPLSSVNYY